MWKPLIAQDGSSGKRAPDQRVKYSCSAVVLRMCSKALGPVPPNLRQCSSGRFRAFWQQNIISASTSQQKVPHYCSVSVPHEEDALWIYWTIRVALVRNARFICWSRFGSELRWAFLLERRSAAPGQHGRSLWSGNSTTIRPPLYQWEDNCSNCATYEEILLEMGWKNARTRGQDWPRHWTWDALWDQREELWGTERIDSQMSEWDSELRSEQRHGTVDRHKQGSDRER